MLLSLGLRAGCAILTEIKPLFPAYYYNDANEIHAVAVIALNSPKNSERMKYAGSLSRRIQVIITLGVYRVFGPRPLAVKLLNALLGSAAVTALAWAFSLIFSASAALWTGLLVAVWPSHVFYTSQNLKESPVDLLAYAALGTALTAALDEKIPLAHSARWALAAMLCVMGTGLYRSYVLVCVAGSLLLIMALRSIAPLSRARALTAGAFVAAALALHPYASRALFKTLGPNDSGSVDSPLIPATQALDVTPQDDRIDRPTSPGGISRFRHWRQFSNRQWVLKNEGREIATQIYPEAHFETWDDVLAYLPKGAFAVLFMPLPGLYPMEGKPGRCAAAGENLILLVIAGLALVGFSRGKMSPERLGLAALFLAMTAGSALLEFDLGSAGRHKLLFMPMLFPFAIEEFFRLTGLMGSRSK